MIVTYASPQGRRVVLADANPAIIALRTSTLLSLEEAVDATAARPAYPRGGGRCAASRGAGRRAGPRGRPGAPPGDEPPPNLGPPPERLDWRQPR